MRADVFQMEMRRSVARPRMSAMAVSDGRKPPENVVADEIHFVPILFVFLIGDGDGLQQHHAVRLEQLGQARNKVSQ